MEETRTETGELTADEKQVFALLAEARSQYEEYLKAQEACGQFGFQIPASEDYRWEKPLTVILCH